MTRHKRQVSENARPGSDRPTVSSLTPRLTIFAALFVLLQPLAWLPSGPVLPCS